MAALADYTFYTDDFKGILIQSEDDYAYFAERASDELALYVDKIPSTEEAQYALQRCACRIADIVYGDFKTSKYGSGGGKISSESISSYYSVSYGTVEYSQVSRMINSAIVLYLGRYLCGARKVII